MVMHPNQRQHIDKQQSMWRSLHEGLDYVRATTCIADYPSAAIHHRLFRLSICYRFLPVFARDIFNLGAPGLGVLNVASGIGALTGAILSCY